jgi:hypothetical protein
MTSSEVRRALFATILLILAVALSIPSALEAVRGMGQPLFAAIAKPALTLAVVAPAFLIGGWLQPRHPLVVGFFAGASVILLIDGRLNQPSLEPFSLLGEALSTGLMCSIAVFAGRQFKRLRTPPNNSFEPKPLRGSA